MSITSPPVHLPTSSPPAPLTEAQLDALAESLHGNRPLPDLHLSRSQLALLIDSEEVTRRLNALRKLDDVQHDAALRADRRAADIEALATLRSWMKSESPAHALRAAIAIFRKPSSLREAAGRPPRAPHKPQPSVIAPPSASPASPAPTPPREPDPYTFNSADALLCHQLDLLHTRKPGSPSAALDLFGHSLAFSILTGDSDTLTTSPALALYLKHLDTPPLIESIRHDIELRPAPIAPDNTQSKTPRETTLATATVILPRDNDQPLRFRFHYALEQAFTQFPPLWVLEAITTDGS
jgi:hypothetical protein